MIGIEEALEYHNKVIDDFGGSNGIRDKAGLEAALARPYMTFDQISTQPLLIRLLQFSKALLSIIRLLMVTNEPPMYCLG